MKRNHISKCKTPLFFRTLNGVTEEEFHCPQIAERILCPEISVNVLLCFEVDGECSPLFVEVLRLTMTHLLNLLHSHSAQGSVQ